MTDAQKRSSAALNIALAIVVLVIAGGFAKRCFKAAREVASQQARGGWVLQRGVDQLTGEAYQAAVLAGEDRADTLVAQCVDGEPVVAVIGDRLGPDEQVVRIIIKIRVDTLPVRTFQSSGYGRFGFLINDEPGALTLHELATADTLRVRVMGEGEEQSRMSALADAGTAVYALEDASNLLEVPCVAAQLTPIFEKYRTR